MGAYKLSSVEQPSFFTLCNGWEQYVPYRCLYISNKLCDSTLCTCGGVGGGGGWKNRCIMLIMTLDPSWRQTLRLPPPGIKPGSPASQAGTLPTELSRQLTLVMRIQDVYPRSRILIFSPPGSWIQNSNKKERGEKKLVVITFYVAKNFTKLQIISVLNC